MTKRLSETPGLPVIRWLVEAGWMEFVAVGAFWNHPPVMVPA
jgi:hypothetical protein